MFLINVLVVLTSPSVSSLFIASAQISTPLSVFCILFSGILFFITDINHVFILEAGKKLFLACH